MTFIIRQRGDATAPITCDFRCEEHGVFEATVPRHESDATPCPVCGSSSPWTPSPVTGKVKRFEVARGGWQKPEHPGWLDTRELGEGQSWHEFQEKRQKIRDQEREREISKLIAER